MDAYIFSSGAERFLVGHLGLHGFDPLYLFPNNTADVNFFLFPLKSENGGKCYQFCMLTVSFLLDEAVVGRGRPLLPHRRCKRCSKSTSYMPS
jgi:hypothetical protein